LRGDEHWSEAASVFSQQPPLTLSPCVPCPPTADCGLEITRIAQVGHKGGQGNGWEGGESEGEARRAGGRGANRGRRGRATLARARQRGQLAELFFFSFRTRAPPRAPALPRTTSGVRSAVARAWYARMCVCVCCVRAASLAQAGRVSTAPGTHPLSPTHTSAPPHRSRPSPPHSQRLHHPHSHTHPSSLHTTPTPLFRVPAPPCAPSSTPTRPAFRPTPARPTVWAPRAPSPSWCPPAP